MTKDDSNSPGAKISRRDIVLSVASGVVGAASTVMVERVADAFKGACGAVIEPFRRRDLVTDLFFTGTTPFEIVPARHHPQRAIPPGRITYRSQEEAVVGITSLFQPARVVTEGAYAADENRTQILTGSAIAHARTREIMGDPWTNGQRFAYATRELAYEFRFNVGQFSHQVSRLQDGREVVVPAAAVIDSEGRVVAVPQQDGTGRLISDVLLVSKLPRRVGGVDDVIYAGLHGPAIKAISILLAEAEIDDLVFLRNAVGDSKHFQAVFEVEGLYDDAGTTRPKAVRLVRTGLAAPSSVVPKVA